MPTIKPLSNNAASVCGTLRERGWSDQRIVEHAWSRREEAPNGGIKALHMNPPDAVADSIEYDDKVPSLVGSTPTSVHAALGNLYDLGA